MQAYSDYSIRFISSGESIEKVADILSNAFENDSFIFDKDKFIRSRYLRVERSHNVVYLQGITEIAGKIASVSFDSNFVISGIVNASESSGEYMNFAISYAEGELIERSSFWYREPDDYIDDMSYEEYLEEYCDEDEVEITEEDFRNMQNGWFIVETPEGDKVMEKVPMDQNRTIIIQKQEL